MVVTFSGVSKARQGEYLSVRIRGLLPRGTVTVEIRKDLSRGTDYRLITLSREEA